jgi:hypothetical protein
MTGSVTFFEKVIARGKCWFPYFYTILFLIHQYNYRTKLSKPPEYPLDIPRYAMYPHDMVPSLESYVRASPLSLAQQQQIIF